MNLFTKYLLTSALVIINAFGLAQQNNRMFNYQAVAHNPQNDSILINKELDVEFYIGIDNQDPVSNHEYSEEHLLTTNNYGLFHVAIGGQDPSLFENLDWANESYYLSVVIGNELISSQLLVAVPYALYAPKAGDAENAQLVNNLSVETAVPNNATFTDNQSLNVNGDSLEISNGSSVALSALSSPDNDWTLDVNNMYSNNSGKLGIGITNPNNMVGEVNIETDANTQRGLYIINNTSANNSSLGKFGVYAMTNGGGTGDNHGAWFDADGNATGTNYGVGGYAAGSNGENIGVFGAADNGPINWAGYFGFDAIPGSGNVKVNDQLVVGSISSNGQFKFVDGNQGVNRILRSDAQGNATWVQVGSLGVGVMLKNTYDSNNNAIVDNAEMVNGYQVGTNVPANAVFTDDQDATSVFYDNTSSNLSAINVQAAIDEVNQNLINSNTAINDLSDGYTDNNNNLYLTSTPNSNITNASHNIAVGSQSLSSNTTGDNNIAIGKNSLLQSNSSAQIAIGTNTLSNTTSGIYNNAVGYFALSNNTLGQHNNAFGYSSLYNNISGNANSAFGHWTLRGNTTGFGNTAVGHAALYTNTIGNTNTAIGRSSMFENISGNYNTAVGEVSLKNNTTGDGNVAVGHKSLETNTTGEFNVSIGSYSLQQNTTSSSNVAVGERALDNNTTGQENVAVGRYALTVNNTGSNNTAIGFNANVGSNNLTNSTAIGANTTVDISDAVILGNNANVGIGTSSPSEKLDVDGNIRMRNGASSGYIPVSNQNGVMIWTSPDSIAPNSGINDLNDGYTDQSNNVYLSSNVSSNISNASNNIALGQGTLTNNSSNDNIAIGVNAINQNTSGSINVGIGTRSLSQNQSGYGNTALGYQSMEYNTTGGENTAVGQNTMSSNTTGGQNTAFGGAALSANTTGNANVAVGLNTQYKNSDGFGNAAVGYGALFENVSGSQNAALGMNSLENNTGSNNSAVGYLAGNQQTNGNNNTFIGYNANTTATSSNNLNNATAIGANTTVEQSNTVVIGNNADVGIGTSSPQAKTHIASYSNPQLILGNTNQPNYEWKTFVNQTGDLEIINENNGNSMNPSITLMNNGKVGIGNSNPQKTLHIYGEVTNFPNSEPSNGNDGVFIDIQNAGAGYQKVAGIRFKTKPGLFENAYYHAGIFFRGNPNDLDQRGTLYFSNKNNLNASSVGTADADMVIKSDGKIGIGTLNPDEQLHVDGKLKIGSSSGGYILPDASGQPGQVLKMPVATSGSNQLVWSSDNRTKEIYLSAHDFHTAEVYNYPSNPSQSGGYPRHVVVFGNNGGTVEGWVFYDFPKPSDWTGSNMTVTIYYSGEKNDGNIRFSIGAEGYSIGQGGYNSPAPDDILSVSQKYTLYSYTKTLNLSNANNSMELISLILSRYDYQYQGMQNPDTNTGKMFLHGIKISYPTN